MKNRISSVLPLCLFWLLLGAAPVAPSVEIAVEKGDNLVTICKKYLEDHTRWREVARVNRMGNPDLIHPGQKIIVPVSLLRGLPSNGSVTFVKGDVELYRREDGSWSKVRLNDSIARGSRLKTGDRSAVEVTFEDGDSLLLRANTDMELARMERKGLLHRAYRLFLDFGQVLSRVRTMTGQESRFEIRTPSALAMARGTDFRVSVNAENATRCEVLDGEVGVRSRAGSVAVTKGEGTIVEKDAAPLRPRRLLSPPSVLRPEPLFKALPLEFGFERVEGAKGYRVMISKDEACRDIVAEGVIQPQERFKVVDLADGTYFLRSLSIDDLGLEGPPSEPLQVRIRVNPLPPYTQMPLNRGEYVERRLSCRWLKVRDAVAYHIQVAQDPEFRQLRVDRKEIEDITFTTELLDYGTYYFRARSVAADRFEGAWSDELTFSIVTPPPAPPLQKPEVEKDRIHIGWRNLGAEFTYRFQMSMDETFREVLLEKVVDQPEMNMERPEKAGTYYVRTSAIDRKKGHEGEFSPPQSFEVEEDFPYAALGVVLSTILLIILL